MKTAFPQTQNPVKIRLYSNIPFDNTYEHHTLISSKFKFNNTDIYDGSYVAKERFLDRMASNNQRYYPRFDLEGDFNFNFQNGLVGSVTLELTPEQTNANYMRLTCGTDVYYYFITGITQLNFETYTLTLELDALMTYQDEFLDGMKNVPVFTQRKHSHRYNSYGLPKCADLKNGDSALTGIKPNIITRKVPLHFKNSVLKELEGILWAYVCVDEIEYEGNIIEEYSYEGSHFPLSMICFPLTTNTDIRFYYFADTPRVDPDRLILQFSTSHIRSLVKELINKGQYHGCKILPYPPFSSENIVYSNEGGYHNIFIPLTEYSSGQWDNDKTSLLPRKKLDNVNDREHFVIYGENKFNFEFEDFNLTLFTGFPSIFNSRKDDPKLLFSPFRKYSLNAIYSQGVEFFPELAYCDGNFNDSYISTFGVVTFYIGDDTISTYIKEKIDLNNFYFFENYVSDNIGLITNVNYNVPVGTDALAVFNATQRQSYYTSKVASGIASATTIAGGIGSIVIGAGMTAGSSGALTPMGSAMVVGGASAIASGVASAGESIKSTISHIQELKNTPDSFNVAGNNIMSDLSKEDLLPYVCVTECTYETIDKVNDYFYNYGYEVGRECYFNDELKFNNDASNVVDNNLFGRTIFNYIKLNEDITNKINVNIPIIIKQKLSQVFNKGITLWSFFGNEMLWGDDDDYSGTYNPDKWFMKCTLDNTEYNG